MDRVPLRSGCRAWSGFWLAGFAHQIFSRTGKEFSQQAGNAFGARVKRTYGSTEAPTVTTSDAGERRAALGAAAGLIGLLSACGARHHDLNVKNVLLERATARSGALLLTAHVLDVDRVEFGRPGDSRITEGNLDRFMRSARKWRELHDARLEEADLVRVAASVRRFVSSRPSGEFRASTRS